MSGAFSPSGIIRGEGASGISFVIQVSEQDDGVVFEIDGETPEGPMNLGAAFDPTSIEGWGIAGAVALLNSHANETAGENVRSDVRALVFNLLSGFDAEGALLGDDDPSDDSTEVLKNELIVEPVGDTELETNLPRKQLFALILKALDTGQSTSAMQKVFGFVSRN